MVHEIEREDGTAVSFIGYPAKLSASPVTYRHAPPRSAQDTRAVLAEKLGLSAAELDGLVAQGIVAEKL
jgi:crotonobetainyl-CoA:carnitine CoA-transferase CaiB-like acyl-CoA transferase